ncbi:Por secretion system C-terminal sorting domain-containing protein [Lishizhenia tianjinensis]|uniref:Por secretion system C-terminal sorting domain-containing protein n=1 Tax=Lishizhenia tianjinensis TaxID=477690 RepID=A0A1I6Y1V4_9FLAO|nr:zinc-dependent metalloprotease [Lishizhenia tianjinensis]SFT44416.1 Por secretion system C-terminal sorting domain-containing protein [Lishizhenia tianjinensis]
MLEKITQALLALLVAGGGQVFAQAIHPAQTNGNPVAPTCGSYELMQHVDQHHPGFMENSNTMMEQIQHIVANQAQAKGPTDLYTIPVVFHVVYNDPTENLPDSVLENQLLILNECFRRQNDDKINTRSEFLPYVGDAGIQFKFAEQDPDGNPTNGITRTSTNITHFGGVLPYGQGQNQEIADWVNDSLYYNYFRLTNDTLGGISAWNTDEYVNIWIGDLRIFEPQFNNFEEIVFFALGIPPVGHVNFPNTGIDVLQAMGDGILMHYVNVGSNNPNVFPNPYDVYNGKANGGKTLVHEMGHYLGLRHIWGDGDCTVDDYVNDTPMASAQSNYNCNLTLNSCVDDIDGVDLPNMVENYMDYSSVSCQNSFTLGQIAVMRIVLEDYRTNLAEVSSMASTEEFSMEEIKVYPNPTSGTFIVDLGELSTVQTLQILSVDGRVVAENEGVLKGEISFVLEEKPGVYFIRVQNKQGENKVLKLMIQS